MNLRKNLRRKMPEFLKNDLFRHRNYADNALLNYRTANLNHIGGITSKIFILSQKLIQFINLLLNFIDRKRARLEYRYVNWRCQKNPILKKNAAFINKHKDQACFILGNGPSLKNQDLSLLKGKVTIAINRFFKYPTIDQWQPTYYCLADGNNFNLRVDNPVIKYSYKMTWEQLENSFKDIRSKSPQSTFFVPYKDGYESNKRFKLLPPEKTYYINYLPYPIFELLPSFPDLISGFPGVQDSSQFAIMLGMAMGCNPIVLLGCDHDWYINRGEEKHFFKEPPLGGGRFDTAKFPVLQTMWFAWVLWRGHAALREIAEKHGIKILNATEGGVLDVYPLARYKDFFETK